MTTFFRTAPTYTDPLLKEGTKNTSSSWYRWFTNTEEGVPPQSETTVTVTGSPFIYTAPRGGFAVVSGGTVSVIAISRTPNVYYTTGQTSGMVPLSKNDKIKITYSGAPTVVFFAQ